MAPTDPHQGGDLFDMAAEGTKIPNDAGKMNLIPSKPGPGDTIQSAGQATNETDIPRTFQDSAGGSEVTTGTGDTLPAGVQQKRMQEFGNPDASKGHGRYDKHAGQKGSDQEKFASDGPGVDLAPDEEERVANADRPEEVLDDITSSREAKNI